MNAIRKVHGSEAFLITQLSMARTFLDMAQLANSPEASARNMRFAATALSAVSEALAKDQVEPGRAQAIEARAAVVRSSLELLAAPSFSQGQPLPEGRIA